MSSTELTHYKLGWVGMGRMGYACPADPIAMQAAKIDPLLEIDVSPTWRGNGSLPVPARIDVF